MELAVHGIVRYQGIGVAKLDVLIYSPKNNVLNFEKLTSTNSKGEFVFSLVPGSYKLSIVPKSETRLVPVLLDVFDLNQDYYTEITLNSGFYLTGKIYNANSKQFLQIYSQNTNLLVQEIALGDDFNFSTVVSSGSYFVVLKENNYACVLSTRLNIDKDSEYFNTAFETIEYKFKLSNFADFEKNTLYSVDVIPQNMVEFLTKQVLNINTKISVEDNFNLKLESKKNYFLKINFASFYYIYHLNLYEIDPKILHVIDCSTLKPIKYNELNQNASLKIKLVDENNSPVKKTAVFYFLYNKENKNQLEELISGALLSQNYGITDESGSIKFDLSEQIYALYIYPFLDENLRPRFIQQISVIGNMLKSFKIENK